MGYTEIILGQFLSIWVYLKIESEDSWWLESVSELGLEEEGSDIGKKLESWGRSLMLNSNLEEEVFSWRGSVWLGTSNHLKSSEVKLTLKIKN